MSRSTARATPSGSRKPYSPSTQQPAQPLGPRGGVTVKQLSEGTRNPEPWGAQLLGCGVGHRNPAERGVWNGAHPPSEVADVPRPGRNCWGLGKWEGGSGETAPPSLRSAALAVPDSDGALVVRGRVVGLARGVRL